MRTYLGAKIKLTINETASSAYQILIDAAAILYYVPFLYMYAAVIKLAARRDRKENDHAVLIPGGKMGVWVTGGLGFAVMLASIVFSLIPPAETANKFLFELKLLGGTLGSIAIGLALYYRGARAKTREAATGDS